MHENLSFQDRTVDPAETCMQQSQGVPPVFHAAGSDRRMCVATGHGDRKRRDACQLLVHRARVRAASARLAELVRDAFRISRSREMSHQPLVMQGGGVRQVDRGTHAQLGIVDRVLPSIVRGQVACGSGIHRDGDVRGKRVGCHLRTAQTHLLLHGECQQQVDVRRRVFQQFDQRGNAQSIVERLGEDRVPRRGGSAWKSRHGRRPVSRPFRPYPAAGHPA